MPNRTCSIDGCERTSHARGYCALHYRRWRTNGDPLIVKKGGVPKRPRNPCSIFDCPRPSSSHGWCNMHLKRWYKHGSPHTVKKADNTGPRPSVRGASNPQWKGDEIGYTAAHLRVVAERGTPAFCEWCETTEAPRFEWALNRDTDELVLADHRGFRYSPRPQAYIRLCISCHRQYDGSQRSHSHTG